MHFYKYMFLEFSVPAEMMGENGVLCWLWIMVLLRMSFGDVGVEIWQTLNNILIRGMNLKLVLFCKFFPYYYSDSQKEFFLHLLLKCRPITPPVIRNRNYDLQKSRPWPAIELVESIKKCTKSFVKFIKIYILPKLTNSSI